MKVNYATKVAFFWDYSVYSYFGIGITEYTEYQFPIKQIACYSENRIADMIKRDQRGRAIFPPKYYSVHSAIGSRMNGIAFRNRNSSWKNTGTVYSGIGINGIVPKERAPILTTSLIHSSLGWENELYGLVSYSLPQVLYLIGETKPDIDNKPQVSSWSVYNRASYLLCCSITQQLLNNKTLLFVYY